MTSNQIRAMDKLKEYQRLKTYMRILKLKYESAIEDAGPAPTWPAVGVVPNKKRSLGRRDPYRKDVVDYNYYEFVSGSTEDASKVGQSVIEAIEKRKAIQVQIDQTNEEMLEIEKSVMHISDLVAAEIVIRRECFSQPWPKIAAEMENTSESTARRRFFEGLEQYGEFLTGFDRV